MPRTGADDADVEPAGEQAAAQPDALHIEHGVMRPFEGFTAAEKKRMLADLKRLLAGIDTHNARELHSRNEVA